MGPRRKKIPGEDKLKRKARPCRCVDKEENVKKIPKDAPTVNRININLMLSEVVRQGWEINSSDIAARAFLQTSSIERNVYVNPLREAGAPEVKFER